MKYYSHTSLPLSYSRALGSIASELGYPTTISFIVENIKNGDNLDTIISSHAKESALLASSGLI